MTCVRRSEFCDNFHGLERTPDSTWALRVKSVKFRFYSRSTAGALNLKEIKTNEGGKNAQ
jgi:hypothetical protein